MIKQKTWDEFRETGLLCWINMILHAFGWSIVCEVEDGVVISAYPARVKFRGFNEKSVSSSYIKISKYMKKHADDLVNEAIGE